MGEEGKVSAYRLVPLEGGPAKGETLYIAVESNDRGPQAYYALVGIAGDVLTIHNFDAGEIATEIGAEVEDSTFDALFKTEADLLAVFGAAADRLRAGQAEAKDIVFRIVDMTNPAGKAEGERILAETAKAEAAEKAARDAETADD
jgi:hypothetical protein